MPPLSAYTPFESLLFFQSLAGLGTRPANFVSISDLLRNNQFVRDNVAFDAHRLSPEALEDLYTTLMRDGLDASSGVVSTLEPNGHHVESTSPSNPKKRKIASPRPEGLSDKGINHAGYVPGLVAHMYARYKELVTKEIRTEEKRFKEIRDEIERLQKEEREAPTATKIVEPAPTPVRLAKQEPAPEPMDLDTTEILAEKKPQSPHKETKLVPVEPATPVGAKQVQLESSLRKELNATKQLPASVIQQPSPRPLGGQTQKIQPKKMQLQPHVMGLPPPQQPQPVLQAPLQPQPQPHPQLQPPVRPQANLPGTPSLQPQPQPLNGKLVSTSQQPGLVPRNHPTQHMGTNVMPIQAQQPSPPQAPIAAPSGSTPTPAAGGTLLQVSRPVSVPAPSPPAQKAPSSAKGTGKKGLPVAPPSKAPQRLPPQSSFQQWSLNQPQTPQPPLSFQTPEPASQVRPIQSAFPQKVPKLENKAPPGLQPMAVPSTPQQTPTMFQSPTPSGPRSGFATPTGPPKGFPVTGQRGSRHPRLSIETPGSLTPWRQTPHLTLPHSPRSPDRPRPEDVSPISEKGPSPFGSREATPEEPEPRRRKRRTEGKGPGRGREKGADGDNKDGPKKRVSTGKKRDRSATSTRSRGRSVLSRDEESATESGFTTQGKIKHEIPGTPAGVLETTEPERSYAGRKVPSTSEERPGRGRPKRKRAPSEVPEAESAQPELSQMTRLDPNQSTPYVLCTRNFPRTGAPIMNEVTTHKHASIFTKPLTERDAPGYPELIYRPQDLKTIKSSIHQGSKALTAATEAASTPAADGESPAANAGTPSKNAVMMLQKTEDVIPPKAIVNSAQLEKELIRMFANAVMFNPIPQRSFGPAFPMIGEDGSRRRSHVPEPDEGGIIKDTLEMFEDVEQAVTRWRAAERTADELASKSILSLRRGSASDPNMDSADDVKG